MFTLAVDVVYIISVRYIISDNSNILGSLFFLTTGETENYSL